MIIFFIIPSNNPLQNGGILFPSNDFYLTNLYFSVKLSFLITFFNIFLYSLLKNYLYFSLTTNDFSVNMFITVLPYFVITIKFLTYLNISQLFIDIISVPFLHNLFCLRRYSTLSSATCRTSIAFFSSIYHMLFSLNTQH